jgi:pSer/pThr/pTyr-binding forkhead associated (FHA) protein
MMDDRTDPVQHPTHAQPAYIIHAYEHRAYQLPDERPFRIGRDSAGDITINEVFVSRQHVEIRPEGEEYVVAPLGATPTLLNDVQIESPQVLHEGDTIVIGTMRFTFTRDRLPVAISIAEPVPVEERIRDTISDRRPTLTFPVQQAAPPDQTGMSWGWILFVVLIVVIAVVLWQNFA